MRAGIERAPDESVSSYRRLFAIGGFPRLAASTLLARTAGGMWQVTLVLFVLARFHSPTLAGLATFLSIVPGLAVSPLAGALLDRHGRVRMILLDYGVAATSVALLAVLSLAGVLSVAVMLPILALSALTGPLSASGARALFPIVVPRALWDRANAVDSGSQALAMVVGPALGGLLVAWAGGEGAFFVAAGLWIVAGVALGRFADPSVAAAQVASERLLRSAGQALVYAVRHTTLRGIMITMLVCNLGFGVVNLALPVLVFRRFHWGPEAVGALWSVAGLATVVAGLVAGRINTEGRERRMIMVGMVVAAASAALLAVAGGTPALVIAMILTGVSSAPIDLGMFALRQRRTDPAWFGRVIAVSMSLNFAGVPIGSALAGPIVDRSVSLALFFGALLSLMAGAVVFAVIPRQEREQPEAPPEAVESLR
ncbi:MAG TPA: MFS transporter [Ktedonobacterales bacterium]|nr:MFS transporter [Ktedonobacterales bacterium]